MLCTKALSGTHMTIFMMSGEASFQVAAEFTHGSTVELVNPLCCLTIPGAVGLHSKEVVQYQFQITLKPTVAIHLFRLIAFQRRFTSFHLFRFATCRQMFEIPPRLHQRGNMWPVWRSTCPLLNKGLPIQIGSLHCAAKVVALLGFAGHGRGRVRRRQQGVSPTRDQDAYHGVAVTWGSQLWWTTQLIAKIVQLWPARQLG